MTGAASAASWPRLGADSPAAVATGEVPLGSDEPALDGGSEVADSAAVAGVVLVAAAGASEIRRAVTSAGMA